MAIQSMSLDPNAASYTDDQIVGKVNAASVQITRASSVAAAARPIADSEVTEAKINAGAVTEAKIGALAVSEAKIATSAVTSGKVASGAAKANLDAMADIDRGYIKTSPTTGQFKVISIERAADGKAKLDYDDVAV